MYRKNIFTSFYILNFQVVVVVTDGKSGNKVSTKREADLIHKTNIQVFSIGIGKGVDLNELKAIASTPDMVSTVGNFNELKKIQDKLHTQTCTGKVKLISKEETFLCLTRVFS